MGWSFVCSQWASSTVVALLRWQRNKIARTNRNSNEHSFANVNFSFSQIFLLVWSRKIWKMRKIHKSNDNGKTLFPFVPFLSASLLCCLWHSEVCNKFPCSSTVEHFCSCLCLSGVRWFIGICECFGCKSIEFIRLVCLRQPKHVRKNLLCFMVFCINFPDFVRWDSWFARLPVMSATKANINITCTNNIALCSRECNGEKFFFR